MWPRINLGRHSFNGAANSCRNTFTSHVPVQSCRVLYSHCACDKTVERLLCSWRRQQRDCSVHGGVSGETTLIMEESAERLLCSWRSQRRDCSVHGGVSRETALFMEESAERLL